MNFINIASWNEHRKTRKYQRHNTFSDYIAPLDISNRLSAVLAYIDNLVVQLRTASGPRGIHFGLWTGPTNDKKFLRDNQALVLDYRQDRFEELREAADRLGYARFWMTTENKARTINTVSLVIPFGEPVSESTYERVAACIAKELDVYGLIDGALIATFITNIHATTMTAFERGALFDAERFKQDTAHLYQERDAHKYYAEQRPAPKAAAPVPTTETHDGMFVWALTEAEKIIARCEAQIKSRQPLR